MAKQKIVIKFDDKKNEMTMKADGKLYTFYETFYETKRAPVPDHIEIARRMDCMAILKAGRVLELTFRGTIASEVEI